MLWASRYRSQTARGKCKGTEIYRTIILLIVLYGCESWSLTLREERRLKMFENMVLRRIFGPNRDEVSGECGKIRNEKLNYLYSPSKVIRMMNSR